MSGKGPGGWGTNCILQWETVKMRLTMPIKEGVRGLGEIKLSAI